jgi:lipoprotein-anchoring transpeptidase ErfK/SrfK
MKKFLILLFIVIGLVFYNQVKAKSSDPKTLTGVWIRISATDSKLYLMSDQKITKSYPISIAKNGLGNLLNSNKTPLGLHEIKKKIGKGVPQNGILKARIPTGKLAKIIKEPIATNTDLVTSRILWLSGLEPGVNKGGNVDSYNRFIYIHGTPEEGLIGQPASHGCIRMYNKDVIELFDLVPVGTKVLIEK